MSTRRISIAHRVDGVLTDYDATPVLRDPTLAYGVKRADDGTVVVAAGTAFGHDGTGLYSYEVTGLTAGVDYLAYVERVYLGATKRDAYPFTAAATTTAEGYYCNRAKIIRKAGTHNVAIYSNLDNDTDTIDEDAMQEAMDETDRWVDSTARRYDLAADATATDGHMLATDNVEFGRVSDLASQWAVTELYRARGVTGDTQGAEGVMTAIRAEAEAELKAIFADLADDADGSTAPGTFQFIPINRRGSSCPRDEFSSY